MLALVNKHEIKDMDESTISDIIEKLSSTEKEQNKIKNQVKILISEFCKSKNMPKPDLNELDTPCSSSSSLSQVFLLSFYDLYERFLNIILFFI
jgi:hypothetical protein